MERAAEAIRWYAALYIGGMGSREQNFYNQLACRMGYEEEAARVQELYLAREHRNAADAVPFEFIDETSAGRPAGAPGRAAGPLCRRWRRHRRAVASRPVGRVRGHGPAHGRISTRAGRRGRLGLRRRLASATGLRPPPAHCRWRGCRSVPPPGRPTRWRRGRRPARPPGSSGRDLTTTCPSTSTVSTDLPRLASSTFWTG